MNAGPDLDRPHIVVANTRWRVISPQACPVWVTLVSDPAEALAVWMGFHTASGVTWWLVARDLLAAGLAGEVGWGAAHLRPLTPFVVEVTLDDWAGGGHALFYAPTTALREFLTETYRLVPDGREVDPDALDTALCALLDGAL